jgi:hypothetical protein
MIYEASRILDDGTFPMTLGLLYRYRNKALVVPNSILKDVYVNYLSADTGTLNVRGKFDRKGNIVITTKDRKLDYKVIHSLQELQDEGFLILNKNSVDLETSLRDYMLAVAEKSSISYVAYKFRKEEVKDTTGRPINEIIAQGYRGNRLDVMVGSYDILLKYPKGLILLTHYEQGKRALPYLPYISYQSALDLINMLGDTKFKGAVMLK